MDRTSQKVVPSYSTSPSTPPRVLAKDLHLGRSCLLPGGRFTIPSAEVLLSNTSWDGVDSNLEHQSAAATYTVSQSITSLRMGKGWAEGKNKALIREDPAHAVIVAVEEGHVKDLRKNINVGQRTFFVRKFSVDVLNSMREDKVDRGCGKALA